MITALLAHSFFLSLNSASVHPANKVALGFSFADSLAEELKKDVFYLADDKLKGRGTPSPELDMAADYIAERFKSFGLKPGNGESFFQETTWRTTDKKVRNVIGIIPGSDSELKSQYVLITAHYDHLGMKLVKEGDSKEGVDLIYNGANDNGSGTAGVINTARLLAKSKPKRTLVFMTFYGEEKGLVGSQYYVKNPVFPLKDTVAMINLEQIGRTDDTEGARVSEISMTGFELSDLGTLFNVVGKKFGVPASGHPRNSFAYFGASDNMGFALAGIPAHTVCTSYEFPDYHKLSDTPEKIDYVNMAKIVTVVAETAKVVANQAKVVSWNQNEPRAKRYIEAAKKLKGES
ncbi:MAG: M28 family peptidase [Armatimonadota bacterium]